MIEFGKELKAAREAKGLSVSQVAESTRIMSSLIEDLERENFTRIVAPIYGRGFVKLYCEAVGLDPAPMVAEFMEIYNGNREPTIRERVPAAPVVEPPTVPATPAVEPPTVPAASPAAADSPEPDLFSALPPPPPAPQPAPLPTKAADTSRAPTFSRYATPFAESPSFGGRLASAYGRDIGRFLPSAGRWSVVVLSAALILAALLFGIRSLYRATNEIATPAVETAPAIGAEAPEPTHPEPTPMRTSRTPLEVPPLYID